MVENEAVVIYSTFLLFSYSYGLLQLVSTFVICIDVWKHSVYTKHTTMCETFVFINGFSLCLIPLINF